MSYPPSQTSSAVCSDFEIYLDADPEVFYSTATMHACLSIVIKFSLLQLNDLAAQLTSLLSGISSFPTYISIQSKWSEVPYLKLHSAVFNGEITQVRFLIEVLHCNIYKCCNEQGHFPLHIAAACGDLNMVKFFIEDRKIIAATESINKETPLHLAALNGHLHIVKYLVSTQLMDPTSLDNNDCSLLHNACRSGNLDVVKYLMSEIQRHQPLDVNEKAIDGITPIHFAAESGNPSLIRFLLKELKPSFQVIADCDVHSKDKVLIIRIYYIVVHTYLMYS